MKVRKVMKQEADRSLQWCNIRVKSSLNQTFLPLRDLIIRMNLHKCSLLCRIFWGHNYYLFCFQLVHAGIDCSLCDHIRKCRLNMNGWFWSQSVAVYKSNSFFNKLHKMTWTKLKRLSLQVAFSLAVLQLQLKVCQGESCVHVALAVKGPLWRTTWCIYCICLAANQPPGGLSLQFNLSSLTLAVEIKTLSL